MAHFRTSIYQGTKAALVAADTAAADRVFVERVEPFVDQRGTLTTSDSLPLINLVLGTSRMERAEQTNRWRGSVPLDVEVFADGASGEEGAETRDALVEEIKTALLASGADWGAGEWSCLDVTEQPSRVDGPRLISACKLTLTLALEESFATDPTDTFDGIDVTVQTTDPDDETTEMEFTADP